SGLREDRAAAVRVPARITGRRRTLGPVPVPRHRAARSVALSRSTGRALDAGRRLGAGRADHGSHRAPRGPDARAADDCGPRLAALHGRRRGIPGLRSGAQHRTAASAPPDAQADTLGVPDAVVMLADSLVILDNVFGRAIVVANVEVP